MDALAAASMTDVTAGQKRVSSGNPSTIHCDIASATLNETRRPSLTARATFTPRFQHRLKSVPMFIDGENDKRRAGRQRVRGNRRPVLEEQFVVRVEGRLVATAARRAAVGPLPNDSTPETPGDEPSPLDDRVHRRRQFTP